MAVRTDNDRYLSQVVAADPQHGIPHAQKQLSCKGRACVRCDKCRDWYWSPYISCGSVRKFYTRRDDATCTGCLAGSYDSRYDCDCCFGGGSYYHCFLAWVCFGRHCECDDNRIPLWSFGIVCAATHACLFLFTFKRIASCLSQVL